MGAIKNPKKPRFILKLFLARVGIGRTIAEYRGKEVIYAQGDPADSVFYIHAGKLKITVVSRQGKEAVIALLGPGDFLGEGCLGGQLKRMGTATAMTPVKVLRITKAATIQALKEEPVFSELFLRHLLSRSIRVEEDLIDQLFNSSEKRLARVLLLLANFGKDGPPDTAIKISQETLAEIVGTTRSRVSFFMNKFRNLGYITYNGTLEVHSSLLNLILHD